MLLDVEWTGIQVEPESPNLEFTIREYLGPSQADWIRNQLGNQRADGKRRSTHGEQHVESRANCAEEHANDPHTNSASWYVFVILNSCDQYFGKEE